MSETKTAFIAQLKLFECDGTHVYPLTATLQVFGAHATLMVMLPWPSMLPTFWPALLPRFEFDLKDRLLLVGALGLSFGIEL